MRIGEVALASGISAKMVRYYEAIGLIHTAKRRPSGYRHYEISDVHRLRLIRIARDAGLSLTDIREILALWSDRNRSSGDIKTMALARIGELQRRLADIDAMIGALRELAKTGKHHRQAWSGMDDARAPTKTSNPGRGRKLR